MGGQAEVYLTCRGVLENAAYAVRIDERPSLSQVWWGRHREEQEIKDIRREFSGPKLFESIKARKSDLAVAFDALYQRTIDFGAHPNERSVTANLRSEKLDASTARYSMIHLHGDNSLMLDQGLKTAAQVGLCALMLFETIWPAKFEASGTRTTLSQLKDRL